MGFLPPLEYAEAEAYWRTVVETMRAGERELIVALERGGVAEGTGSGAVGGVGAGGRGERNNTRSIDGHADRLSDSLGHIRWGEVPGNARSGDGELHTTVFYYQRLQAIQSTLCV